MSSHLFSLGAEMLKLNLRQGGWDGELVKAYWIVLIHMILQLALPFLSESCAVSGPCLGHGTLYQGKVLLCLRFRFHWDTTYPHSLRACLLPGVPTASSI